MLDRHVATVGDPPGYSIELIHPSLDNTLAGSWRSSSTSNSAAQSALFITNGSVWKYQKGTNEASLPTNAWRFLNFDDSAWSLGAAPIGYDPSVTMGTPLGDMNGGYISFFVRKTFVVDDPSLVSSLVLEAL